MNESTKDKKCTLHTIEIEKQYATNHEIRDLLSENSHYDLSFFKTNASSEHKHIIHKLNIFIAELHDITLGDFY